MIKQTCEQCGKEIDGYSKNHVDYLMLQHKLVHRKKTKVELHGVNSPDAQYSKDKKVQNE